MKFDHVDTTNKPTNELTHISLCAGYGGIDLGLHRVFGQKLRTIAFSEIEAFAVENLLAKMEAGLLPAAPVWTDLRTFPWADFQGVDILSGGFPCQPFSAAGKRNADSDPRHLFPAIVEGIRHAKPRLVFLENVEGIVSSKLAGDDWRDPSGTPVLLHVLRELERVGYRATAGIFSASEVGAPHQRKRVFILAHSKGFGGERLRPDWIKESSTYVEQILPISGCKTGMLWPSRPGELQHGWEPPRVVGAGLAHARSLRRRGRSDGDAGGLRGEIQAAGSCGGGSEELADKHSVGLEGWAGKLQESEGGRDVSHATSGSKGCSAMGNADHGRLASGINAGSGTEADRGGQGDIEQAESGQTQPALGRDADGPADWLGYAELFTTCDNRTDELRLLGNGVVPATAEKAFLTLIEEINK